MINGACQALSISLLILIIASAFPIQCIISKTSAKKFLIRVPLFERDWQIAFRKEIGSYYFSDQDHKIEHTLEEFKNEILLSKLKITEIFTIWGEIWASCINDQ